MGAARHDEPIAATLADWTVKAATMSLPEAVRRASADTLIDTVGLVYAARHSDYVTALKRAWPGPGHCTVIGAAERRDAHSAAMINGTAAHGEDFDNTFEGCPVHPGAVVVPAVLAIAEARGLRGADVVRGIAVGQEIMCRMGTIAGRGIHHAGFHPTAVIGALGAAAAAAAASRVRPLVFVNALGIAGSMASGIIEYLADGTWTKRMHAGWAAQSGLRALAMAESGFTGPATVLEGRHGFFHAFAPSVAADFSILTGDLGQRWFAADVAFKPYASGTMTQPFIDCALALRNQGVSAADIAVLSCAVGEGTVHRLWEPLAIKRQPPTAYAAKFSTPYCIAVALVRGAAGLSEFSDALIGDRSVLDLARRVEYRVDPDNEYPRNYSAHIRAELKDGRIVEASQPHLRGGIREPLSRAELVAKCAANLKFGGVDASCAETLERFADALADDEAPFSLEASGCEL